MVRRTKLLRPWTMAVLTLLVLAAIAGLVDAAWRGRQRDDAGRRGTVEVTGRPGPSRNRARRRPRGNNRYRDN